MTPFSNPLGSRKLPKRHEASQMDSPRESTAVGKAWLQSRVTDSQVQALVNGQQRINQELGKVRRRIVGGGGASSSTGMVFKGEYNGGAYPIQSVVVFVPDGGAAGTYVALKAVPAGKPPDVGAPYWIALPFPPAGVWS